MTICNICLVEKKKYKCPTCDLEYCSVKCFKIHKDSNTCKAPVDIDKQLKEDHEDKKSPYVNVTLEYKYPTKDSVPIDRLKLLGANSNIRNLLENRNLRNLLTSLCKTRNIKHAMNMVMLEPIFVEFAMECLKVVEPEENESNNNDDENKDAKQFIEMIKELARDM